MDKERNTILVRVKKEFQNKYFFQRTKQEKFSLNPMKKGEERIRGKKESNQKKINSKKIL